jgi:hypothetical protein
MPSLSHCNNTISLVYLNNNINLNDMRILELATIDLIETYSSRLWPFLRGLPLEKREN